MTTIVRFTTKNALYGESSVGVVLGYEIKIKPELGMHLTVEEDITKALTVFSDEFPKVYNCLDGEYVTEINGVKGPNFNIKDGLVQF